MGDIALLERFQLLSNIGKFDNAVAAAQLPPLTKLSLIYGENGRGKMTLAAILKSASTGDPAGVLERRRLGDANWGTQDTVAGDDSRLDARAKIEGSDVFCRTLIEHFGTRHILFEFKNYEDKIGANLIHITEKYLYAKALRGAAVIISPEGFSDPAKRAAHGALRDVGKLMLDLDVPLLCKLLEAKDLAQPPGAEMERLMDALLLGR